MYVEIKAGNVPDSQIPFEFRRIAIQSAHNFELLNRGLRWKVWPLCNCELCCGVCLKVNVWSMHQHAYFYMLYWKVGNVFCQWWSPLYEFSILLQCQFQKVFNKKNMNMLFWLNERQKVPSLFIYLFYFFECSGSNLSMV